MRQVNGFLVMMRHGEDDLPLFLTNDINAAKAFALNVKLDDGRDEAKILNIDATTPMHVQVYEFRGGRLSHVWHVHSFEDEIEHATFGGKEPC